MSKYVSLKRLTDEEARAIYRSGKSPHALAAQYAIPRATVWKIKRGERYARATMNPASDRELRVDPQNYDGIHYYGVTIDQKHSGLVYWLIVKAHTLTEAELSAIEIAKSKNIEEYDIGPLHVSDLGSWRSSPGRASAAEFRGRCWRESYVDISELISRAKVEVQ